MTISQTPSGAPAPSGPSPQSGRHAARNAVPHPYAAQPFVPQPRPGVPAQRAQAGPAPRPAQSDTAPRPAQPGPAPHGPRPVHRAGNPSAGRHYDGHPGVPFGGPPFGRVGAPAPQRPAVPTRSVPGPDVAAAPQSSAPQPSAPQSSAPQSSAMPWPTSAQRGSGQAAPAAAHPAGAPRNGLGTAALVLGIIGALFSLVPIVGVIAWPLVIVGLVLGVLGIVGANRGRATNRGVAISGTVLCAIGLVVCIAYAAVTASAVAAATDPAAVAPIAAPPAAPVVPQVPAVTAPTAELPAAAPAAAPASAGGDVITYEVTGSGTAGSVTYVKDANMGMEQVNGTSLPWTKDVTFDGGAFSFQPLSLVAQSGSGGNGEITCRILRDGQEITSSTSSGPYAVVTCSGS